MVLAGAAALTWFFAFFLASFSFLSATVEPPEPGHRVFMDFVAPALLGLATVPITRVLGAGWGLAAGISAGAFSTGVALSVLAVDGTNLRGGVGTFLLVTVVTPALAVLAASVKSGLQADDMVGLAGGLALTGSVLALLVYSCSLSTLPLALLFGLCAWAVFPVVAVLAGVSTGRSDCIVGGHR